MLYTDVPINKIEDDLLGRASFAKATARSLSRMQDSGTFTVGLFGKWGTGKTSLLNMILQEMTDLEKDNNPESKTIVIRFEPWNFSTTDQLLSQFFVRLINEFYSKTDKNLQKVSNAIEKYFMSLVSFTKLIPGVGDQINEIANSSFSLFKRKATKGAYETDIQQQKENVIKILESAHRRLLIVIDDIDRLNNDQIRCVFQLVTAVAKFPHTTYLLAFDKEIVARALEDVQKGSGEAYLEKVIQIPIQIPALWKGKIEDILFHRLDEIIAENNGFNFDAKYWQKQYPACVKPFIQTLRDINRLCNSVRFKIQGLADDLNFTDIVAITALEIQYPTIYDWIISNKTLLTGGVDEHLILASQWKKSDWEVVTTEQWKHLLNCTDKSPASVQRLEEVTNSITHLFPFIGEKLQKYHVRIDPLKYNDLRAENHIAHPEKFDRYFDFKLGQSAITRSELMLLLNGLDLQNVIERIRSYNAAGQTKELLEEIRAHYMSMSPERITILIHAILRASDSIKNDNTDFFYLGNRTTTKFLLLDLFARIPYNERFPIIEQLTMDADNDMLDMLASLLNTTELAYGRLAAEGNERREITKIITLDDLLRWEKLFTNRIKELLETKSIFDFCNSRTIIYLMSQFEKEYTTEYMRKTLTKPFNVIRFLEHTIAKWTGDGISYEVRNSYQEYISEQSIIDSIIQCKKDGSLFRTDDTTQLYCAVFYLHYEKKKSDIGHISNEDAQKLLSQWKSEANHI